MSEKSIKISENYIENAAANVTFPVVVLALSFSLIVTGILITSELKKYSKLEV